nr:hypothetical protein [Lysinibacillus timonensis]
MTNQKDDRVDVGTAAKVAIVGGILSSIGEFIQAISASLIAIEKMQDQKKVDRYQDAKIIELEKQVNFLMNEIKRIQK